MTFFGIVTGIVQLLISLTQWLNNRQLIAAADHAAAMKVLTAAVEARDEIKTSMDEAARKSTPPPGVPVSGDPYERD